MSRCVFYIEDENNAFINIEAEEFHEDGDYIKAYQGSELVGFFKTETVKAAYRTYSPDIGRKY